MTPVYYGPENAASDFPREAQCGSNEQRDAKRCDMCGTRIADKTSYLTNEHGLDFCNKKCKALYPPDDIVHTAFEEQVSPCLKIHDSMLTVIAGDYKSVETAGTKSFRIEVLWIETGSPLEDKRPGALELEDTAKLVAAYRLVAVRQVLHEHKSVELQHQIDGKGEETIVPLLTATIAAIDSLTQYVHDTMGRPKTAEKWRHMNLEVKKNLVAVKSHNLLVHTKITDLAEDIVVAWQQHSSI